MCPPSREISLGLSEPQKYFLRRKLLKNACFLLLPKDYPSVMSLSMLSDLWMFLYWEKQPSSTAFNNCAVEMQQNGFFQVTFSATRSLKQKNIVSIQNQL